MLTKIALTPFIPRLIFKLVRTIARDFLLSAFGLYRQLLEIGSGGVETGNNRVSFNFSFKFKETRFNSGGIVIADLKSVA